jgi:hypothetical protein
LALCNNFDKFATFTFDPKKHDAYDARECKRIMIQWLNNTQKACGAFRYLIVAEPTSDGKTHFHALLGGFTGKYHATNKRGTGDRARQCYKVDSWERSNGFADMEDIQDTQRLVNYIVKYLAKDINNTLVGKNERRYWASKNLNRPKIEHHATLESLREKSELDFDKTSEYENDHCFITTIPINVLQYIQY